jgi:hypothetical protein
MRSKKKERENFGSKNGKKSAPSTLYLPFWLEIEASA